MQLIVYFGSPTRARTWDLRINRSRHPKIYACKVEEKIVTFFAPPIFPNLTEPIPNLNGHMLLRFSGFQIRINRILEFSLNRFRTHPLETECWRAPLENSPRTAPKLPTATLRGHPMGMGHPPPETGPRRTILGTRRGNFHPLPRSFRPVATVQPASFREF